jgi:hypothetical protein
MRLQLSLGSLSLVIGRCARRLNKPRAERISDEHEGDGRLGWLRNTRMKGPTW